MTHPSCPESSPAARLTRDCEAPLLRTLLNLARRISRADACAIWQREAGTGEWRTVADAGLSEAYSRSIAQYAGAMPDETMHFEDVARAPLLAGRAAGYRAEGIRSLLVIPLTVQGEHTATLTIYYRQPHAFDQEELNAAVDLADLASQAITAARLNEEQARLRAAAQAAERRAAFLAEASKLLASSLDYETTLTHVAQMAVPGLADWCVVDLVDGEGSPRQVAVAHADPAKVEWARSVRKKLPYDPDAPAGVANVLRTGMTELYAYIPDELLVERVKDPEQLAILREVGFTSLVTVPLPGRTGILGALTLIAAESGVRYDEKTVALAEELGRRAAAAIENARLLQEAQAALAGAERSEARLRRLVDANIIGVQVGDSAGAISYANDAFLRMTGYTQQDLAAGRLHWQSLTAPEHQELDRRAVAELAQAGVVQPYEKDLIRKDGTRLSVLVGGARFEDKTEDGVAFVLDVSERKRLEEQAQRLAAIVASSDDAIVSKDLNGIVRSWNKAAERIFGYREAEMVGQSITRIVPPERPDEEPQLLARLRRGERIDHFETVRVRKDGRRIDVSVTISPVRNAAGEITGASKIARDITGQKALQRELQERVEALALADRRKDEFLAMLAHELRNPLAPLVMAARVMQRADGDQAILARQQAVIERQVKHMSRLLDDLLDVSRITRGKVTLRKEAVDLAHVVGAAVEASRAAVDQRNLALTVILPEEPVSLVADPMRLEQAVGNLLLNAAKYTEPGGSVVVDLAAAGNAARLAVRDTGIGIAPEFLPSVFDLFAQADRGLDRSQGGLGIGLTVVRRLIELHGGTVEAYSEGPGRGSEFVIRLPLAGCEPVGSNTRTPLPAPAQTGRLLH